MSVPVPVEVITEKILLIRGRKVILDRDLANLYGVETRILKQAVRRNIERFPNDFMFELTDEEFSHWRSQFVMSKEDRIGLRHKPMAFTEQGVAMLSSVLRSKRAIEVNIMIMRAFVRLRELLSTSRELVLRLERLERKLELQGETLSQVVQIVNELLEPPETPRRQIGFVIEKENDES
jgi:hypothetical protein